MSNVHIVKEEFILGPSSTNVVPVMSTITYQIHSGDECVRLSFEELNYIGETIKKVIERDKPFNDMMKDLRKQNDSY